MNSVVNFVGNKTNQRFFAGLMLIVLMFSLMSPNLAFADDGEETAQGINEFGVSLKETGEGENGMASLEYFGMEKRSWTTIIMKYRMFIIGGTGIATVTLVGAFVISLTKLGTSAGNPQERSKAITGCLWTGIASALLGSATVIIGFFFNSLS